jgi:RNA polymerase sigma factor (TIGR02999 family)
MRHERQSHTLQPTALVNEAFLKIQSARLPAEFWMDEGKVLGIVAHAMEQILNDWADAHSAKKRGGQHRRRVHLDENQAQEFAEGENVLRLDSGLLMKPEQSEEVLGVREALTALRRAAPRQARIMQLQFYGGLTQNEVATALGLSVETIKIETRKAKAFLKVHLTKRQYLGSRKTA